MALTPCTKRGRSSGQLEVWDKQSCRKADFTRRIAASALLLLPLLYGLLLLREILYLARKTLRPFRNSEPKSDFISSGMGTKVHVEMIPNSIGLERCGGVDYGIPCAAVN